MAPFTYRSVAANLFDDIANQKIPPGPGPQASSDRRRRFAQQEELTDVLGKLTWDAVPWS